MNIFIYFSTYIIFLGILYFFNIINYNPIIWLIIASCLSFFISIYIINIIFNNINIQNNDYYYYQQLFNYLILNIPKLLLIIIIDKKNLFKGFVFYSTLFIIYLILIDFNLYEIYFKYSPNHNK